MKTNNSGFAHVIALILAILITFTIIASIGALIIFCIFNKDTTAITNAIIRTEDGTIIAEYEDVVDSFGTPVCYYTEGSNYIRLTDKVGNDHTYYGQIIVELHEETPPPPSASTSFIIDEVGPPASSQTKG